MTSSGPRPNRSVTPGRNDSRNTSAASARRNTVSTPAGFLRSTAMDRRPRSHAMCRRGPERSAGTSLVRSTRTMLAPISASLSEPNGSAPRPASSMMRMPSSGPAFAMSVQRREQHRVFGLSGAVDVDQDRGEALDAAGVRKSSRVDRYQSVDAIDQSDDRAYRVFGISRHHHVGV